MFTSTLAEDGRVLIPERLRVEAHLKEGQRFAVRWRDGEIVFTPLPSDPLLALRGAFAGADRLSGPPLLGPPRRDRDRG
jgi:bifunctional DNA-binding transcriptional regulator/antitoxin component of YhaV-PrlF toxin-antitoxin module